MVDSVAPRKAVAEQLETMEFDGVVVITYNSQTKMVSNWWHFSWHPDYLGTRELSIMAQQMTSDTAEALKTDVNNPSGRPVEVKAPKVVATGMKMAGVAWICLFAAGFRLRSPKERLWFGCYLSLEQFGVKVAWGKALHVLLGPLAFYVWKVKNA